ncbi:MAG TPA: hypothetical protein VN033_14885 [Vulgatibacter sp.]|nr:hypothetical protein [Vulgatibacter sp.]
MMSGRLAAAAGIAAAILAAAPAHASEDPRDDLFFGGEEEEPARPSAGRPAPSGDERDAAFFGEPSIDERDAAFFGGEDVIDASAPSDRPVTSDELQEEGRLLSGDEIERRMGLRENKLDVGGNLFLRMNYAASSKGIPETFPVDSPNLLDLYLDARPSDRLRAFVRGRVTHWFDDTEQVTDLGLAQERGTRGALDQLWLKFDVERTVFVTAGRQSIRWGVGRFWNPTDFVNVARRDPLAVLDERLGVSLLKLHVPVEASGWNLYGIANLENASRLDQIGGAFRVEKLIGTTEVSVSTAVRKDQPFLIGADVSFPVGLFDLRAEVALSHGDERLFFRGPVSLSPPTPPTVYTREDEWIPQAVVGAEVAIAYSEEDSLSLGAEYFYNGAGYDDTDLYPWLFLSGNFTPLYLGKHYAALYASAAAPGSWNDTTLIASLLSNLGDGSFLSRFDYRVRLLTFLDVNAFVAWHFGSRGEMHFGLDLPKVDLTGGAPPGVPPAMVEALAEGVSIAPPLVDVGVGAQLRF